MGTGMGKRVALNLEASARPNSADSAVLSPHPTPKPGYPSTASVESAPCPLLHGKKTSLGPGQSQVPWLAMHLGQKHPAIS